MVKDQIKNTETDNKTNTSSVSMNAHESYRTIDADSASHHRISSNYADVIQDALNSDQF